MSLDATTKDPATDYCQCFSYNNDVADDASTQSICTKLGKGYTYYPYTDPKNPGTTYPGVRV